MAIQMPDHGPLTDHGSLRGAKLRSGCKEIFRRERPGHQLLDSTGLLHLMVGQQRVGSEVRHHAVARAPAAQRMAQHLLRDTEEALRIVARRGDTVVVKALEQVVAVTTIPLDQIVDERAYRRGETCSGRQGREIFQVSLEPSLGFVRCPRSVRSVGIVGQLVGDPTEDLGVAPDTPCCSRLVPGGLERLAQLVEQGPTIGF